MMLAVAGMFVLPQVSRAQKMVDLPDGTSISTSGVYGWGSNTLYFGPFGTPPSWQVKWTAPGGTSIRKVARKIGQTGGGLPTSPLVFIMLDDGSVYSFRDDNLASAPVLRGKLKSNRDSDSWAQLLAEDIYVLSDYDVYVSHDSAATFSLDTAGLHGNMPTNVAIDTGLVVYLSASNGLFWQQQGANVWARVAGFPDTTHYVGTVFVDIQTRIFVTSVNGSPWVSTDRGATWTIDTAGTGGNGFSSFGGDMLGNIYAIGGSSGTGSNALYRSLGGVGPWTRIDSSIYRITASVPNFSSIDSCTNVIMVGTSFGGFISTDQGATWSPVHGAPAQAANGLARRSNGRLVVTTSLGIFYKDPADTSWTQSYPAVGYSAGVKLYQDGSGDIYTSGQGAPLGSSGIVPNIMSTDGGSTWNLDTAGLSSIIGTVYNVDELGNEHYASSLYGGWLGILYVKAPGGSWQVDTMGFSATSYSFGYSIHSNHHGKLYASGYWPLMGPVVRRPIAGGSWSVDTVGLTGVNYFQQMVDDTAGNMFGTIGSAIYFRANGGWSTIKFPTSLSFSHVTAMSCDKENNLFAAFATYTLSGSLGAGVYFSPDNGATWTYAGLDSINVNQLKSFGDTTYALTDNGLFELTAKAPTAGVFTYSLNNQWNLISVPQRIGNPATVSIFPKAQSNAFAYQGSYMRADSLYPGAGYWLKFSGALKDTVAGSVVAADTIAVSGGWNLIGSVSGPVAIAAVVETPDSIVTTHYFGYQGSYAVADTLYPGSGYWVKTSQSGTLGLLSGRAAPKASLVRTELNTLDQVKFSDASGRSQTLYLSRTPIANPSRYELPPLAPAKAFDARFASGLMVETATKNSEPQVVLSGAAYPLKVEWKMQHAGDALKLITDGKVMPMASTGSVKITHPVTRFSIGVGASSNIPVSFSLGQNYPNPFNPTTTISYAIPTQSLVTLKVFNVLGQEVTQLVNEEKAAGNYTARFDGSGLASGVYFYVFNARPIGGAASGFNEVKKLILMK
jgi:hypothetical protein